ncbi:MAG: hypothetical protein JST55_17180 [Bacteroidetes bacterium]|nr:hypothetical protein [Bacteroidota bacterium]
MSFVSERTLEYSIVPKIRQMLKLKYKRVIPIFYWVSREGNLISEEINKDENFKVLAVYLRRPKIQSGGIFFKVNQSIIDLYPQFNKFEIPVICVLPLASNITELDNQNLEFHSIDLKNFTKEIVISFACNFQDKLILQPLREQECSFLSSPELYSLIDNSKINSWDYLIKRMRILRQGVTLKQDVYYRSNFFGGGYQPVYFLIQD